jgi:hypothetical protein
VVEGGTTEVEAVGDDSTYDIRARVVTAREDAWVIDCGGLLAFREETPPDGIRVDSWIAGRAWLDVDPFFYFEGLAMNNEMPALIYSWSIDGIQRQTAPFIETSRRTLERDATKLGWKELSKTDAWHDDDGSASYSLLCTLLDVPPKRESATAT